MNFKHIHFIINPAAGENEPVLSHIHNAMADTGVIWDVSVTTGHRNIETIIKEVAPHTDLVAIYGGDGSVCVAAGLLQTLGKPMAIVPGGTANVVAKELGIPVETMLALQLLADGGELKKVDMGLVNGVPFLLRVNLGLMADMVIGTSDEMKGNFGQLAYGLTALRTISDAERVSYRLVIDGALIEEDSVALTITNCGSTGIGSLSLQPGVSPYDGVLDVLSMQTADLTSIVKVAGSSLLHTETDAVKHWTGRNIQITSNRPMKYLCDDADKKADELMISILPQSLSILVPKINE